MKSIFKRRNLATMFFLASAAILFAPVGVHAGGETVAELQAVGTEGLADVAELQAQISAVNTFFSRVSTDSTYRDSINNALEQNSTTTLLNTIQQQIRTGALSIINLDSTATTRAFTGGVKGSHWRVNFCVDLRQKTCGLKHLSKYTIEITEL